ncbi:MAG: hypothetical protein KAQ98_13045 [Bacteriovoracaceae bacterium]|nr:hypothetical protein [Bacteriovoracaceae bacterium]
MFELKLFICIVFFLLYQGEGVSQSENSHDEHEFVKSVRISDKYDAGNYLIYDCIGRHFACVNGKSFRWCKLARKKSKILDRAVFACAPLKKFESLKECSKKQYELIHSMPSKIFCINSMSSH